MERERLFELRRRTFDTPEFRGIEFIEVEAKSVINHVPGNFLPFNWTINPYRGCSHSCTYCFARVTHTYMDMSAGRDFESKIVVKVNAPGVLRRQLAARSWKGDHIAMGTATDPSRRAASEGAHRCGGCAQSRGDSMRRDAGAGHAGHQRPARAARGGRSRRRR